MAKFCNYHSSPRSLLVLMDDCLLKMIVVRKIWLHLPPQESERLLESEFNAGGKCKANCRSRTFFTASEKCFTYRVKNFVQVMSNTCMVSLFAIFPVLQTLQIISVDVSTACHLGVRVAVRTAEAVPLVNSRENDRAGEEKVFTSMQVESALRMSQLGKRSKQRFLRINCQDSVIKVSRKGAGGNNSLQLFHCETECTSSWDY